MLPPSQLPPPTTPQTTEAKALSKAKANSKDLWANSYFRLLFFFCLLGILVVVVLNNLRTTTSPPGNITFTTPTPQQEYGAPSSWPTLGLNPGSPEEKAGRIELNPTPEPLTLFLSEQDNEGVGVIELSYPGHKKCTGGDDSLHENCKLYNYWCLEAGFISCGPENQVWACVWESYFSSASGKPNPCRDANTNYGSNWDDPATCTLPQSIIDQCRQ